MPKGTCQEDGCVRVAHAQGRCNRHYMRALRAGTVMPLTRPTSEQRFWSKVDRDGPVPDYRPDLGPCWLWTAATYPGGYGSFAGTPTRAHRWAYENVIGPIPDGLHLDHLCRIPPCVNPSHLEPVTNAENHRRAAAAVTRCNNGHEYTPQNTRVDRHGWRKCRVCDREQATARRAARTAASE